MNSTTLIGYENWNGPGPVTINLTNGSITYINFGSLWSYGNGMASDVNGNTYFSNGTSLYRVNTSTGSLSYIGSMSLQNYEVSAMTFHLDELWGVDGDGWGTCRLISINTSTAAVTNIGNLPNNVDALGSAYPTVPSGP